MVLLDAVVLGFIVDRLSHSPLWGILCMILAGVVGFIILSKSVRSSLKTNVDKEMLALLTSAVLALIFFVECAVAAWLILA